MIKNKGFGSSWVVSFGVMNMKNLVWVSLGWSKSIKKVKIQYELLKTKLTKLGSMRMCLSIL
jgi:hypothetical protein